VSRASRIARTALACTCSWLLASRATPASGPPWPRPPPPEGGRPARPCGAGCRRQGSTAPRRSGRARRRPPWPSRRRSSAPGHRGRRGTGRGGQGSCGARWKPPRWRGTGQNVVTYDVGLGAQSRSRAPARDDRERPDRDRPEARGPQDPERRAPGSAGRKPRPNKGPAAPDPRAGQVWVLGADDTPQSVSVRLGASDGAFTEVRAGALGERERVIVGSTSPSILRRSTWRTPPAVLARARAPIRGVRSDSAGARRPRDARRESRRANGEKESHE
jgi:hypothetical protein